MIQYNRINTTTRQHTHSLCSCCPGVSVCKLTRDYRVIGRYNYQQTWFDFIFHRWSKFPFESNKNSLPFLWSSRVNPPSCKSLSFSHRKRSHNVRSRWKVDVYVSVFYARACVCGRAGEGEARGKHEVCSHWQFPTKNSIKTSHFFWNGPPLRCVWLRSSTIYICLCVLFASQVLLFHLYKLPFSW